ncbi:hypothetical protein SAMN04488061_2722 [Filomicrobium insigne]|uniref:JmjC domain-containing protein n=1 Tax=Filomicrobium insigne TaxID=418854 RepID=A0A1H0RHT4_9HYPH|nr:cupin-like domain-containing protein [Filomicrobium insigne]SDP28586.1 hypothetical protein SAMN04488061_2722 [Filomicrobium insigne]
MVQHTEHPRSVTFPNNDMSQFGKGLSHFQHDFLSSGLFTDERLARLIERYPREYYMITTMTQQSQKPEWRNGDLNGVSGEYALEAIRNGRLWLCLRRFDLIAPEYDDLVADAFAQIESMNPGLTTSGHKSSLLISSPGARVLYHADIPMVSLWHLRGRKRVWLYDPNDKTHLPDEVLEGIMLRETEEEIPYDQSWDQTAQSIVLEPGYALSWPHNAPHRVDNLEGLNVSITTDYFTPETKRRYGVYYTNGLMRRRLGVKPRSTSANGIGAYAKCAAALAAKKVGVKAATERSMMQTFKLNKEMPGALIDLSPAEQQAITQY